MSLITTSLIKTEECTDDDHDPDHDFLNETDLRRNTYQSSIVKYMDEGCNVFGILFKLGITQKDYKKQSVIKLIKEKEKHLWTHLIMSGDFGGGFSLPNQEKDEFNFLKAYALDVDRGVIHYLIEKKTKIFKFFLDLDIKKPDDNPFGDDNILKLIKDLIHCVKQFYPPTTSPTRFDVMVCVSEGKKKTGIHPIFPNLYVNINQAIDMRNYFVNYLIRMYGDMVGIQNSWQDIVDMSVLGENGLRMVGAHKVETCPECKGGTNGKRKSFGGDYDNDSPRKESCGFCRGRGKIDTGKFYVPRFYMRQGESYLPWTQLFQSTSHCLSKVLTDPVLDKQILVVQLCSIRCPSSINESSSGFAIVDEEMVKMLSTSSTSISRKQQQNNNNNHNNNNNNNNGDPTLSPRDRVIKQVETEFGTYRMSEEDHRGMNKFKQKQFISGNSEIFQMIQEFIQSKSFPRQWQKLNVHNVFTNPKKTFYIVNVRGEGQHYCLNNRNLNHKSNSIYFYIEHNSLHQRCFCSCQTTENRKFGKCEDFCSEKIPIPTKLDRLLFPTIPGKTGLLNTERTIGINSDADEYMLKISTVISRLDENIQEYLEDRERRLAHKKQEMQNPGNKRVSLEEKQVLVDKLKKRKQERDQSQSHSHSNSQSHSQSQYKSQYKPGFKSN